MLHEPTGAIRRPLRNIALVVIALLVMASFGVPGPAWASAWRFGDHGNYERLVVPLPASSAYVASVEADGTYVIHSDGFSELPAGTMSGKRMRLVSGADRRVVLKLALDSAPRSWRSGNRLVIDVYAAAKVSKSLVVPTARSDPEKRSAPGSPSIPALRKVNAAAPAAGSTASVKPVAGNQAIVQDLKLSPAIKATPGPASPQAAASVELHSATPEFPAGYFIVPAAAEVGAAAFLRDGTANIILDAPLSLDIAALKDDPAYGALSVQVLPGGTQMRMPGSALLPLNVVRRPPGWLVGFGNMAAGRVPIVGSESHGRILLATGSPSRTLVLKDGQTGARLLVGTVRGDGAYSAAGRQTPEFSLPLTVLGVVVSPSSDRIDLKAVRAGFELAEWSGAPLATLAPQASEVSSTTAAAMTRRFDIPDLPVAMLRNRLHSALREAALAPKAARTAARLQVAQAMLALGMDVEAQAALSAAAADDPAFTQAVGNEQLRGIAAWLAGRSVPARAHADPASGDHAQHDDEGLFWDTMLTSRETGARGSSALLAATWPIAFNYSPALRSLVLPRLADLLGQGGEKAALAALLKAVPDASLDYARAQAASADGQTDAALALFDRVANSNRRDDVARARRAAVELRLSAKKIDLKSAADALKDQLYAWRGDGRELDLRLRLAALLAQNAAWRPALAMLRETDRLFPAAHSSVHDAETNLVTTLVQGDAATKMPSLELVSLVGECADLLGENAASSVLAPVLVDKLLALDLPARAEPILVRLLKNATGEVPRAELGLRLAGLRLAREDAAGAATALNDSQAASLPSDLDGKRLLLRSRIRAMVGDNEGALQLLAGLNTAEALEQSATLLEKGGSWKQASAALSRLVLLRIAAVGTLAESQAELVLRLTSDEAQAGDTEALRQTRRAFTPRLNAGAQANLLQVLTQTPVEAVSDLARAGQELAAARSLPTTLAGLPSR